MTQVRYLPNIRVPQQMLDELRAISARKQCDLTIVACEAFAMYIDDYKAGLLDSGVLVPKAEDLPSPEQLESFRTRLKTYFDEFCEWHRRTMKTVPGGLRLKTKWRIFVGSVAGDDEERRTATQWNAVFATIEGADRYDNLFQIIEIAVAKHEAAISESAA